jgi:Flp pilus assembly protein TadD
MLSGFLVFANGLHNGFMVDDHAFFDEKMRNIKYLFYQFLPDKEIALGIEDKKGDSYYRPLAHVVPMLAFLVFGNNVVGYHALNIVLWALAAWMVFIFLRALFEDPLLAFAAAFIYMVHPINGVVVNYITADVFAVQIICMVGSLWFLLRGPVFLAVGFFVLAIMCHETAMTLPFYAFIILMTARQKNWKEALKGSLPLWLTLGAYFLWRLKHASLSHSILDNFSAYHMNVFEYAATLGKLIWWYLTKLFYPVGIVMIEAKNVLRDVPGIVGWLMVLLGLAAGGVWLGFKGRSNRAALTGLCWFAMGFLPFSFATLFRPSHGMMIEPHWFIFSVIGFFIWLTATIKPLCEGVYKKAILAVIGGVVACWIIASIAMNEVWDGDINYCRYWIANSANFSAPMFYLAMAYQVTGHYEQARYWYGKAAVENYQPEIIYLDLGFLDIMENRYEDAKKHLSTALSINPNMATAVSDMGMIAFVEKDYLKAKEYFLRAIAIDRFQELPRLNLGKVYLQLGQRSQAIQAFEDILSISPNDEMAMKELMAIYWQQGDKERALEIGRRLTMVSRNPALLAQVGMMAQQGGDMVMARRIYNLLTRIAPNGISGEQDSLPGVTGLISAKRI